MDLIAIASQYFLNPYGFLALIGLIPLLIFYLIKPQPKQQIMPSMMFFMKDKNKGKVSQALQTLFRNLLLLFHILFIIGLAAAVAQPFFEGFQQPDNGVIVLDRSASMSNDLSNAKSFANSNLAEENTLIIVGREVTVPMEDASAGQVRSYINGLSSEDVETDIGGGLESAQNYEGQVVVASDLDQTVNSRNINQIIGQLRQTRNVKVMDFNRDNSWGIVDVKPGKGNSTVEVQNFEDESVQVGLKTDQGAKQINIDANSVETVTVQTDTGTNTVELEEDGLEADNKAFISIPEDKQFDVLYIGDQKNSYFSKAVELISFTDISYEAPPVDGDLDADVYVIGETSNLLEGTAKEIESQVESGSGLVMFGQSNLRKTGFSSAPNVGNEEEKPVEIVKPVRASIGSTTVHSTNGFGGESLSEPRNAVMKKDLGEGQIVFYNIEDSDFNTDFMYPIFWKNILSDLTERPSSNELNIQTGQTISDSEIIKPEGETVSGEITAVQSGYYNTSNHVYAANLESTDESLTEETDVGSEQIETQLEERNMQHMAAILLAILAMLELLYLLRIGDI